MRVRKDWVYGLGTLPRTRGKDSATNVGYSHRSSPMEHAVTLRLKWEGERKAREEFAVVLLQMHRCIAAKMPLSRNWRSYDPSTMHFFLSIMQHGGRMRVILHLVSLEISRNARAVSRFVNKNVKWSRIRCSKSWRMRDSEIYGNYLFD